MASFATREHFGGTRLGRRYGMSGATRGPIPCGAPAGPHGAGLGCSRQNRVFECGRLGSGGRAGFGARPHVGSMANQTCRLDPSAVHCQICGTLSLERNTPNNLATDTARCRAHRAALNGRQVAVSDGCPGINCIGAAGKLPLPDYSSPGSVR